MLAIKMIAILLLLLMEKSTLTLRDRLLHLMLNMKF